MTNSPSSRRTLLPTTGLSILLLPLVVACAPRVSVKQIGEMNMVATRNVDMGTKHEPLRTYAGGSHRELRESTSTSIEDAINETVRAVPGGEFLMNVKVYLVSHETEGTYIAVEGDVWGRPNVGVRGIKPGDLVTWKRRNKFVTGKVVALRDADTGIVEPEDGGKIVEVPLDELLVGGAGTRNADDE